MTEPDWQDPQVQRRYKTILPDLGDPASHNFTHPFRVDEIGPEWRGVCACGFTAQRGDATDLLYAIRSHALTALRGPDLEGRY